MKQMRLGAFLPAPGHHIAAWRHPEAKADGGHDIEYYIELAKIAEQGKFDMMFLSDGVGVRTNYRNAEELSRWGRMVHFEPITLLSAIATHTQHLGLVATASTTYNEPFHIARKYASLDHLSHGRAAWNVVTSVTDAEAQNFNLDQQPAHADRYRRAQEFIQVTKGLWDSWKDDAFLYDKQSGQYFEPEKLKILDHKGEYFQVKGPLNIARSPQGYPVIVQAGSSKDGMRFAAEHAEVIFTAQQTLEQAQAFYQDIKAQAAGFGRAADQILVMPGVFPVIAESKAAAEERYEQLQDLIDPVAGLGLLMDRLGGFDLTGYDLDGPLPEMPETEGSKSRQKMVYDQARNEQLTIRQLIKKVAGGRGHRVILGTASDIADQLEEWFVGEGADGFNVMPPYLPACLAEFVNQVVPELQRRGLFRTEYKGSSLRDHLGLDRPSVQRVNEKGAR
ncbi:nitrilotriacetate monooxygenase [Vibrio harveyi]|uniref:LLM class flavin-dependent oxidoreductase n=1 Tax=Vibrio harveyi TaxID=669 RepID=UPI00069D0D53|nr:LLM class flavin-dependent oxidoreductase [Vibrio harveyi]KNY40475.1 nitrilotriacetate monooxygenase [Vibrio harveyi]